MVVRENYRNQSHYGVLMEKLFLKSDMTQKQKLIVFENKADITVS